MNVDNEFERFKRQITCDVCGQNSKPERGRVLVVKTWSRRADIMCPECWHEMMMAYEKYILGSDSPIRPAAS